MLKSTRQSFDDKKCAATRISWTKFYWKPCQQNVEGYFSFDSKPHYGGQEDGGDNPISLKKTK